MPLTYKVACEWSHYYAAEDERHRNSTRIDIGLLGCWFRSVQPQASSVSVHRKKTVQAMQHPEIRCIVRHHHIGVVSVAVSVQ